MSEQEPPFTNSTESPHDELNELDLIYKELQQLDEQRAKLDARRAEKIAEIQRNEAFGKYDQHVPNKDEETHQSYLNQRPADGVLRDGEGFRAAASGQYASEASYTAQNGTAQSHYDTLNGIENTSFEAPKFDNLSLTQLAKEAAQANRLNDIAGVDEIRAVAERAIMDRITQPGYETNDADAEQKDELKRFDGMVEWLSEEHDKVAKPSEEAPTVTPEAPVSEEVIVEDVDEEVVPPAEEAVVADPVETAEAPVTPPVESAEPETTEPDAAQQVTPVAPVVAPVDSPVSTPRVLQENGASPTTIPGVHPLSVTVPLVYSEPQSGQNPDTIIVQERATNPADAEYIPVDYDSNQRVLMNGEDVFIEAYSVDAEGHKTYKLESGEYVDESQLDISYFSDQGSESASTTEAGAEKRTLTERTKAWFGKNKESHKDKFRPSYWNARWSGLKYRVINHGVTDEMSDVEVDKKRNGNRRKVIIGAAAVGVLALGAGIFALSDMTDNFNPDASASPSATETAGVDDGGAIGATEAPEVPEAPVPPPVETGPIDPGFTPTQSEGGYQLLSGLGIDPSKWDGIEQQLKDLSPGEFYLMDDGHYGINYPNRPLSAPVRAVIDSVR